MRYRIRQVWASRSSRLGKLLWNWPHLGIQRDFLVVVVPFFVFFFFLAQLVASYSYYFSFPFIYRVLSFFSVLFRCRFPRPVIRSFGDRWVVFPLTIVFRCYYLLRYPIGKAHHHEIGYSIITRSCALLVDCRHRCSAPRPSPRTPSTPRDRY